MILAYRLPRACGWVPPVHVGLDWMQGDRRLSKREDDRVLSSLKVGADSNGGQTLMEMDRAGLSEGARGDGRKRLVCGGGKRLSGEGRGRRKEG